MEMCFPWSAISAVLIYCIIIAGVVAIISIVLTRFGPKMGWAADIVAMFVDIFKVVLWVVVGVAAIVIVGDIIVCLFSLAPSIGNLRR
jgi:hypothetical protein